MEWIGAAEPAGVNEAHEHVADPGTVERFVEQRVLTVADGALERTFADVIPRPGLCRVAA